MNYCPSLGLVSLWSEETGLTFWRAWRNAFILVDGSDGARRLRG